MDRNKFADYLSEKISTLEENSSFIVKIINNIFLK